MTVSVMVNVTLTVSVSASACQTGEEGGRTEGRAADGRTYGWAEGADGRAGGRTDGRILDFLENSREI